MRDRFFKAQPIDDIDGNCIGGRFAEIFPYQEFLTKKQITQPSTGLEPKPVSEVLFPFQKDIVGWSLRIGRAAIFADCGLGKTFMQLEWAKQVPGKVLILAPLAVAEQTESEAMKLGLDIPYTRVPTSHRIVVTNYQMLNNFNPLEYKGIVLDESSILKSFEGKFRNQVIEAFQHCKFRLACTATPAPNDHMELGNHSEFLGVMTRTEMLSTFFVHDGGETRKWRLKRHAVKDFWKWVCSWAVYVRKPSDLGYKDDGFELPELRLHESTVESDKPAKGTLFPMPAVTMSERREARKETIDLRGQRVAGIVATKPNEQWIIWCALNNEAEEATDLIPDAVEIRGSEPDDVKCRKIREFLDGKIRVIATKGSMFGFGLNLQCCHNQVFFGLGDSWELFYQCLRRSWRFMQTEPVDAWIVTSSREIEVLKNIRRKEADAKKMADEMVVNMNELNRENPKGAVREQESYKQRTETGRGFMVQLGDCVDFLQGMVPDSIHYSIFSPPFASLYTYSASERDMGNCHTHAEFYDHFKFCVEELYRVLMPGRLLSFHCMNLPTSKERDGVIGITDFRGDLIRMFQETGFIYHSEVVIWKDPVTAMQRTKALGLLHKQLKKDSCMSRQGIPDYLVTMRKLGDNPERVEHTNESFPVSVWQRYASPIWMDINPSDTLQKESAREQADEKHICPLQLEVIRRALELWTNPNDLVLSPFAGIGSEGYEAIKMGRRFLGIELKESYFTQAVANLKAAEMECAPLFAETR